MHYGKWILKSIVFFKKAENNSTLRYTFKHQNKGVFL